jgi:SAM-dependent methyltransferase
VRATAPGLPIRSESVDAVVACLVLEHVEPFEPAIDEIARVLEPGGHFVLFLNHPLLQTPGSGFVDDHILGEQYWRVGPYLPDDETLEEVAPGVRLPFMHRPLGRYINVMADRGLLADHMDEPPPSPGFVARAPEYGAAATIPRLLVVRTRKLT